MKMKKTVIHSLLAALLLNSLLASSLSSRAQPRLPQRPAKSRALLVGINRYQQYPAVKNTSGAEDDALETATFIKAQYGFKDEDISLLLGAKATAQAIRAEFRRWLIAETQPGDRVFFLYAGHGSQMKDTNGDEADGQDEVLAPYDVSWRGDSFVNVILDDELDGLLKELTGRLAVLVFDSCNSGTISRGGQPAAGQTSASGDARYLPRPEQLADLPRTRSGEPVDYTVQDTPRVLRPVALSAVRLTPGNPEPLEQDYRDLKVVDVKQVGSGTGIVVISAAHSSQVAYSLLVNGNPAHPRGALSYVFAETQRHRRLSVRQLRQELRARVSQLQSEKRLQGNQVPQLEIISTIDMEDGPLFAVVPAVRPTPPVVPVVAETVLPGNPQSSIRLGLRTRDGKTAYHIGETVSYQFTTNAPGYLYLIVFSQQDVATCIFPNEQRKNNRFEAGTHVVTSDGNNGFLVGEPVGKDVVVALLSATPVNLGSDREGYTWNEVFAILKDTRFGEYVRSRGQTAQKPAQLTNWQAVNLVLETIR